ncbi:DUF4286 family protein [Bradyrhizobium erythrophlei]|jgi:hypothetical protein|uniref:Uncharacterized protein n=1 Tax=Bradyrhizobium erythrophlei TaxID=1437360 RepID=A0A1M5H4H4_9BRAD|nr:DUF4286 family protein [Bradyrhizobium erythrophlei]SHG10622.1 hypothetical protein SAMN05444169_0567 [Bradyrhizobium erythrophlei]
MPLAGKGMLLTSMDIDPDDEGDFNRWYDREHLIERVAIDGFLEARRYIAHRGSPKYLCLYSTETFEVLDSPAYRKALTTPTEWSKTNLARFKNMIRTIARITVSHGQGRGAVLGIIRLRPAAGSHDRLRASLRDQLDPEQRDGIISMHLIESDPALSKPLTNDPPVSDPGAGDWFVLIDATNVNAVSEAMAALAFEGGIKVSSGSYNLMWDLARSDIRLS